MNSKQKILLYVVFPLIFVTTFFMGCMWGSVSVPLEATINVLKSELFKINVENIEKNHIYIIWNLRMPRVILGFVVGGGLAIAGASMQSITKNVMADPYILGVSSGSLAFVSIGFLFGGALANTNWFIPLLAFIGALFALLLVILIGGFSKDTSPVKLVLAGSAVSITLSSMGQLGMYLSDTQNMSNRILMWMMGSLAGARWNNILIPIIASVVGLCFFLAYARAFDLISLGDETAISLGSNVTTIKRISLFMVAFIAGVSVASCGIISLIGFVIPHFTRFLFGTGHKRLFPLSFFIGGIFLIFMDLLARMVLSPTEIPVGIFTSVCGGPYFIWILRKKGKIS